MKIVRVLCGLGMISTFLLASCATTEIISDWKDDTYTGGHINSVMIVGVSNDKNKRKIFERAFVKQFRLNGIKGVASIDVISQGEELNKDTIKGVAHRVGADSVIITHLVSVDKKETYHPPTYEYRSDFPYPMGPAYYRTYTRVSVPGYYTDTKTVFLESNLYETKTEKLIWSAHSKTISQDSKFEIIEDVCKAVMTNLRKNGLLK